MLCSFSVIPYGLSLNVKILCVMAALMKMKSDIQTLPLCSPPTINQTTQHTSFSSKYNCILIFFTGILIWNSFILLYYKQWANWHVYFEDCSVTNHKYYTKPLLQLLRHPVNELSHCFKSSEEHMMTNWMPLYDREPVIMIFSRTSSWSSAHHLACKKYWT